MTDRPSFGMLRFDFRSCRRQAGVPRRDGRGCLERWRLGRPWACVLTPEVRGGHRGGATERWPFNVNSSDKQNPTARPGLEELDPKDGRALCRLRRSHRRRFAISTTLRDTDPPVCARLAQPVGSVHIGCHDRPDRAMRGAGADLLIGSATSLPRPGRSRAGFHAVGPRMRPGHSGIFDRRARRRLSTSDLWPQPENVYYSDHR